MIREAPAAGIHQRIDDVRLAPLPGKPRMGFCVLPGTRKSSIHQPCCNNNGDSAVSIFPY
jgi:hypothetical protein